MYRFCLLVIFLLISNPAHANTLGESQPRSGRTFPGPRPSLADLWQNADHVIFGEVERIKPLTSKLGKQVYTYGAQNVIYIKHQFKGPRELQMQSIVVETRVTSEAPCSFEMGTQVIAFIRKDDGKYIAGSSHSRIVLEDGEFKHYKQAFERLPEILSEKEDEVRRSKLVAWYVDLAVEPVTRYQGALGLSWARARSKNKSKNVLSDQQARRLIKKVVSESPPIGDTASVLNYLKDYPSRDLDLLMLESLRRSHEPGWERLTRTAFDTLPARLGVKLSPETEQRRKEWGELLSLVYYNFDKKKPSEEQQTLYKERYHIVWGSLTYDVYIQCRAALENDALDSK